MKSFCLNQSLAMESLLENYFKAILRPKSNVNSEHVSEKVKLSVQNLLNPKLVIGSISEFSSAVILSSKTNFLNL